MSQQIRRLIAAWLASGVALAVLTAIPASAAPNTRCALTTSVQEVRSKSQLPPELLKLLPPIADVGQPFNSTDSVSDPNAPFRRLIRAGHRGADWFIWYEHGGAGYSWQAVVARVALGSAPTVLANAQTISDTLCTLTDGVLAGQVPPYPPGAWPVSDF
ncbi:hypothetical protein [Mycobacterium shigaense]|uniref:hypothetical protein n=1 Tax=Mycobacterium shigaense TaxID=722731 RepID=UPI001F097CB5|nr:hypothetical protein [Mycobacterium shigaense]MEA1124558.1 hypothetical protein [Mycobacterium shigaense]